MNPMPENQINAHLGAELIMRVGIRHRGGTLAVHASDKGYPAKVSASAFWDPKSGQFKLPGITPLMEVDFALDSAGFTAMKLWKEKGAQAGMAGVFSGGTASTSSWSTWWAAAGGPSRMYRLALQAWGWEHDGPSSRNTES